MANLAALVEVSRVVGGSVFGGAIRDLLTGNEISDLDVFIQLNGGCTIKNFIGRLLIDSRVKQFSLSEKKAEYAEAAGFMQYDCTINGVDVDLVFSASNICENWNRKPDASVNLLYTNDFKSLVKKVKGDNLCSRGKINVLQSEMDFSLEKIVSDLSRRTYTSENGVSETRIAKIESKGFRNQ